MADYTSKFTGQQIDEKLTKVDTLESDIDDIWATINYVEPTINTFSVTPNQYGNLIKYDGTLKAIVGANSSYTYNFIAIIKTGFKAV